MEQYEVIINSDCGIEILREKINADEPVNDQLIKLIEFIDLSVGDTIKIKYI